MKKVLLFAIISALIVSVSITSISAQSQYNIPSWVKGIAGFWAEDKITDNEFGEGLSFLIDNEIIKVPKIQELQNKITQLEDENTELRKMKGIPRPEPTPEPEPTPTKTSINVQTDDSNYDEGDTIVVSGSVSTIIGNTPIIVHLFSEGNLVDLAQITVAQDGTFTKTFLAEGTSWKEHGDYLVRISYGEGNIAETKFSFTPKTDIPETTAIFEVDVGSHGTFDVEYSIREGAVKDMTVDYNNFALIVQIESTDEGTISLDLFRKFIGAEKQDGKDDTFIVLIDGIEVAYQESAVHSDFRTVTINFEEGDNEIKIIGSFLIGADPDSTITVKTDKAYPYSDGDLVRITGEFTNIDDPGKVSVKVYNYDGDFIETPRVFAFPDNFSATIFAGGSMYDQYGEYSIKVFYNDELKVETTFWYNPN